jgi:hypothetical protein
LPEQKIERTEGEPQEHNGVDDQPDDARCHDGNNKPAPGERRINPKVGEFRQQEGDTGRKNQRRRR